MSGTEQEAAPEPDTQPEPDEQPEPDTQPEPDEQPEPDTPVALSEKDMERVFKDVERLRKDVAGRVGRIFGDSAGDLMGCPMCAELAPGWLWPPEVAPLPEAQQALVLAALGFAAPASYKPHPSWHRCPACEGQGKVYTGSKVAGYDVVDCPNCTGKGWEGTPPVQRPALVQNGNEQDAGLTGPLHYTPPESAQDFSDDPAVRELRGRGFLVVEPVNYGHG